MLGTLHEFGVNPEQIDRDEDRRVQRMAAEAAARPHLRASTAKLECVRSPRVSSEASRFRRSGFRFGSRALGYSSAIALGDAVRKHILDEEESRASQGHCRILMKNGTWLVPNDERPAQYR